MQTSQDYIPIGVLIYWEAESLPGHFCWVVELGVAEALPLFSNSALLRATVSLSLLELPSEEQELSRENVCLIAEKKEDTKKLIWGQ